MVKSHVLPRRSSSAAAFTLVELLVVIGIIALLISILLPGLAKAQKAAQRTSCASKLHEIMQAAILHADNHLGYYPLAGVLPACTGANLNDHEHRRYTYLSLTDTSIPANILAPITIALAREMANKQALGAIKNDQIGKLEQDSSNFIKYFTCPSQNFVLKDVVHVPFLYTGEAYDDSGKDLGSEGYSQFQSYIYNEYVVGADPVTVTAPFHRLAGQAGKVHQPAQTMFAADGLEGYGTTYRGGPGSFLIFGMYTIYPKYDTNFTNKFLANGGVKLSQAFVPALGFGGTAGDPGSFDKKRHDGRMNIAFCDGHVDSRAINSGDLSTVFIVAP